MSQFKFSVGPWNVHPGADSYGPETRKDIPIEEKFKKFAELGFSAVQFHDDDAVPNINDYTEEEIKEKAREMKALLDKYGLAAEFVAPRLWMDPHTIDGGFMSTRAEDREYAMWRAYRSIDIARELGCDLIVLWLAREGTLCAESKSPVWATKMLVEAINKMLEYDKTIRVCIEPKPNEPIDRSICGTMGHVMAVSAVTIDPSRVGGNLESAHATLAGLDPAHEIGFALAMGKLMTVHLNDQNGLKYDQDKSFGVENLRAAFNQVKVLKENGYGEHGEYVGLDVKAMRTTTDGDSYKHLENSLKIFKALEEKVDRFDYDFQKKCVENRDFECDGAFDGVEIGVEQHRVRKERRVWQSLDTEWLGADLAPLLETPTEKRSAWTARRSLWRAAFPERRRRRRSRGKPWDLIRSAVTPTIKRWRLRSRRGRTALTSW